MRFEWINESGGQAIIRDTKEHRVNLSTTLDNTVSDFFRPLSHRDISGANGNMIETRDDFRLKMVAPGMKKEDFTWDVQGDMLRISYEHDDSREGMSYDYTYRSLARSFMLPKTADIEKIQATYENGILKLILPKKKKLKVKSLNQIETI